MSHTIYMGYAAMQSRMDALELISNNLANQQSSGFKQQSFAFHVADALQDPDLTVLGSAINGPIVRVNGGTDFTTGSLAQTGNPLDLALTGDGFFVVRTPQGNRYTRDGNFRLSTAGELQTSDGFAVLGTGGSGDQPIVLPQGKVEVSQQGQVNVDGVAAGTLKIVTFKDAGVLTSVGASLFSAPAGTQEIPPAQTGIAQGFLESSNVNPVATVTQMIGLLRSFELLSQAVRTISRDVDQKLINELARF